MAPSMNTVSLPPQGLVVALQYWAGDEVRAMRLARLISDIEPKRRDDVTIAFCRRFDMVTESAALWETWNHVAQKFRVMKLRSRREGVGHPDGCNALWSGTMDILAEKWWAGNLPAHSVFTIEADGCPLRTDWLDILRAEHELALAAGKLVSGCLTNTGEPHINGSLIAHLSLWLDHPSLQRTPNGHAWDLFHAAALVAAARPSSWIKNVYGAAEWSAASLQAMCNETAWLSNSKDESALAWAEQTLVEGIPSVSEAAL
jgi:hypothetical protein